jgi:hypothetical protein
MGISFPSPAESQAGQDPGCQKWQCQCLHAEQTERVTQQPAAGMAKHLAFFMISLLV